MTNGTEAPGVIHRWWLRTINFLEGDRRMGDHNADLAHEANRLNDLMDEAFGERPMYQGMDLTESYVWTSRLHVYWLTRLRTAVMALEDNNRTTENGTDQ